MVDMTKYTGEHFDVNYTLGKLSLLFFFVKVYRMQVDGSLGEEDFLYFLLLKSSRFVKYCRSWWTDSGNDVVPSYSYGSCSRFEVAVYSNCIHGRYM
jgi:hypothetical protein